MTSVVEPQKQAPTGQTEGRFAEAIEGVVTLPLAEVRRRRCAAGVQGSAALGAAAPPAAVAVLASSAIAHSCRRHTCDSTRNCWPAGQGEALRRDGARPGERRLTEAGGGIECRLRASSSRASGQAALIVSHALHSIAALLRPYAALIISSVVWPRRGLQSFCMTGGCNSDSDSSSELLLCS